MYSYQNYIPLSAAAVGLTVDRVGPPRFDRIYSRFQRLEIPAGAKEAIDQSEGSCPIAIAGGDQPLQGVRPRDPRNEARR
jgi:hypothetical protein